MQPKKVSCSKKGLQKARQLRCFGKAGEIGGKSHTFYRKGKEKAEL